MDPEILKMAKDARKRLIQQDAQFQRNLRADSLFTPELKKRMEEDTKRTHQSWLNRKVNDAIQEYLEESQKGRVLTARDLKNNAALKKRLEADEKTRAKNLKLANQTHMILKRNERRMSCRECRGEKKDRWPTKYFESISLTRKKKKRGTKTRKR